MSTKKTRLLTAVLAAFGLLMSVSAAFAHDAVVLKDGAGSAVTSTTPYSTKMTCGGCHFKCSDNTYSTDKNTWCDGSSGNEQKDCSVADQCPDYQSADTAEITKEQGYLNDSGGISYMTYTVKIPLHGAATGKHSSEGRNEGLETAQRTIWAAPATISGPGMYGRY